MQLKPYTILKKVVPLIGWLPEYDFPKGISDLVGGITVGLTLIPQSIAYAALIGLTPEYGLYASLVGGVVYGVFGTIAPLNIAPTALLSLLSFTYSHSASFGVIPAVILLCFLSGIVELLCGIFHLGFLIDFVSIPVVTGFTSAGAITVATAQVKNLLGLKFSAHSFMDVWKNVFIHISETNTWDAVLSLCCCTILLCLRQLKTIGIPPLGKNDAKIETTNIAWKKLVWFISVSRNASVVIASAVLAYVFGLHEMAPFTLTTQVKAGLPNVTIPPFSVIHNNQTFSFFEMAHELSVGVFVIAFVAILGNVAIAKAFADGKVIDASQEMIAVGICNIIGAFFSSVPVNASFSRAAVSNASGTRTPFSGLYTSIMVVLSLTFLTPYFSYIPTATLASVIICAVLFMVEVSIIKPLWKINKIDMIPFWITFVSCLVLGIEIGILIGIAVDLLLLVYYTSRPKILIETISEDGFEYTKITPNSGLLFSSVEYFRETVAKKNAEIGAASKCIIIDCCHVSKADFTASKCLGSLADDLIKSGKTIIFLNLSKSLTSTLTGHCKDKSIIVDKTDLLQDALRSYSFGINYVKEPRFQIVNDNSNKNEFELSPR